MLAVLDVQKLIKVLRKASHTVVNEVIPKKSTVAKSQKFTFGHMIPIYFLLLITTVFSARISEMRFSHPKKMASKKHCIDAIFCIHKCTLFLIITLFLRAIFRFRG